MVSPGVIQYGIYNTETNKFVSEGSMLEETTFIYKAELYKSIDIAIIRLKEFRERAVKRKVEDTHKYKLVEVNLNYKIMDNY